MGYTQEEVEFRRVISKIEKFVIMNDDGKKGTYLIQIGFRLEVIVVLSRDNSDRGHKGNESDWDDPRFHSIS